MGAGGAGQIPGPGRPEPDSGTGERRGDGGLSLFPGRKRESLHPCPMPEQSSSAGERPERHDPQRPGEFGADRHLRVRGEPERRLRAGGAGEHGNRAGKPGNPGTEKLRGLAR